MTRIKVWMLAALVAGAWAGAVGLVSTASAQWTVVPLHPAGAYESHASGVRGNQQVGRAILFGGVTSASVWNGTAASWLNLHPAGTTSSRALGGDGAQQVGFATVAGTHRASLWNGTAASWMSLHPAGATASEAVGVDGGQQVGYAIVGGDYRASLWSGSAASWLSLHPAGASWSFSYGVHGGQQVGDAVVAGVSRASLWTGTAASWVDLNPQGVIVSNSIAYATDGVQQVGSANVNGSRWSAGLWRGTAASWVNLDPNPPEGSAALGVHGGQQVGYRLEYESEEVIQRAQLWNGVAWSRVDLHALLPAGSFRTVANGIWHDGAHTYVVGTADGYAVMWVGPPAPCLVTNGPQNQTACIGQSETFSVVAAGVAATGPFTYQWRFNAAPINATTNPSAATATLELSTVSAAHAGSYDCIVSNSCGSVTSNAAILWVCPGGWTVVRLHPAGATGSLAKAVGGGQQVGQTYDHSGTVSSHAVVWSGTAASWVDLNPAGSVWSSADAVDGGQQVGYAVVSGVSRASLWSGTAASRVDLHPAGAESSWAKGIDGGQQAGWAIIGGAHRAGLWSGTAASWVNLNPAGATASYAYGVHGGQQVGWTSHGYGLHASLWSGTAASWLNLQPAGQPTGWDQSLANGVHGGQQVGALLYDDGQSSGFRACLWSGSAASWIDLNPAGWSASEALGVHDGQQVGYAGLAWWETHAGLWSGTAASWLDLHNYLPSEFTTSIAHGIWHDGAATYVVGSAYSTTTLRNEAVMWVGPAAGSCYPDCTADGALTVADFGCFQTKFVLGDPYADCNGQGGLTVADFACFQTKFVAGCP